MIRENPYCITHKKEMYVSVLDNKFYCAYCDLTDEIGMEMLK